VPAPGSEARTILAVVRPERSLLSEVRRGRRRLPKMILGRLPCAFALRELDHRRVQELTALAKVLRLENGGRTVVRLPPARSNRGSMTKTRRAAMRSRSSSRTFQSSTWRGGPRGHWRPSGRASCRTTVPSSSRNEPNHVVKRSMARGERARSVKRIRLSRLRARFLLRRGFPEDRS